MQTAQATKTTCKVALLVTSTVATGGTTGVLAGTALVVKGADAIVEVAAVGSTILLGEGHEVTTTLKDVQAYTAPAAREGAGDRAQGAGQDRGRLYK